MARSLYITSAEGHTGKSTIALGVLEALRHSVGRVGVFRPIARSTVERDYVLELLLGRVTAEIGYEDAIGVTYEDVHADADAALGEIVRRFRAVEARSDAVVIIGSDYTDIGSPTELGYNAREGIKATTEEGGGHIALWDVREQIGLGFRETGLRALVHELEGPHVIGQESEERFDASPALRWPRVRLS